jgi:hypothetical protein
MPTLEEPVTAEAAEEPKSQPVAKPASPAPRTSKRPMVVLLVLGGLAAAFGGLMAFIVCCAGIGIFLLSGDRKASVASDSKGQSYSDSYSTYSPGYANTDSSYSSSPTYDFAATPGASGGSTDQASAAAAPSEKARREEEQRRYAEEYWAQRDAEEAAARAEAEEAAERYQEAFREAIRMREAYP